MWLQLVLANLLALGAKAFVAAPIQPAVLPARTFIQWAGLPAKRFILTPTDLESEVKPQSLTIRALFDTASPAEIPTFIARPDKTINLADAGLCIEASGASSGDVVRLNRCIGSPAQLWITSRGSNGRIQLEGTDKCINVDAAEEDLNGALVDLRECEDKTAQSWMLEEHIPLPTQSPAEYPAPWMRPEYPAPSMRHVSIALISVAALTALIFIIWWRRRHKAPTVAMSQGGCTLNVDHGGICLAKPLPVRNVSLTPAVMALSPGLEPGHAVKELDGSTDMESHKKLTLNDWKDLLGLLGTTVSGTRAELIRRLEAALTPTPASTQDERPLLSALTTTGKSTTEQWYFLLCRCYGSRLKALGLKANGSKMELTRRLGAVMVISPTPEAEQRLTVNFSPGRIGIDLDNDGKVMRVFQGQAQEQGVKVGTYMTRIDGQIFAPKLFHAKYSGTVDYEVEFYTEASYTQKNYVWTEKAADNKEVTQFFGDFKAGDVVRPAHLKRLWGTSLWSQSLLDSELIREAVFVGEIVERRDGSRPWRKGCVTSIDPVKVSCGTRDPFKAEGFAWDEVRRNDSEARFENFVNLHVWTQKAADIKEVMQFFGEVKAGEDFTSFHQERLIGTSLSSQSLIDSELLEKKWKRYEEAKFRKDHELMRPKSMTLGVDVPRYIAAEGDLLDEAVAEYFNSKPDALERSRVRRTGPGEYILSEKEVEIEMRRPGVLYVHDPDDVDSEEVPMTSIFGEAPRELRVGDKAVAKDELADAWTFGIVTSVDPVLMRFDCDPPGTKGFAWSEIHLRSYFANIDYSRRIRIAAGFENDLLLQDILTKKRKLEEETKATGITRSAEYIDRELQTVEELKEALKSFKLKYGMKRADLILRLKQADVAQHKWDHETVALRRQAMHEAMTTTRNMEEALFDADPNEALKRLLEENKPRWRLEEERRQKRIRDGIPFSDGAIWE